MNSSNKLKAILLLAAFVCGILVRLYFIDSPGHVLDLTAFARWTKSIGEYGVFQVYEKNRILMPPMFVYLLWLSSTLHGLLFGGSVNLFFLKLPGILGDLLTAAVIFFALDNKRGFKIAYASMVFFLFNPAVVYNSAYWGQWDSMVCFFMILSVVFLTKGRPYLGWIALTLGILTKIQAVIIVPLFILITLRKYSLKTLVSCVLISLLTSVFVCSPFIISNHVNSVYRQVWVESTKSHPFVTINAYNIWRIYTQLKEVGITDINWYSGISDSMTVKFLGFNLTLKLIGTVLFTFSYVIAIIPLWFTKKSLDEFSAYFASAFVAYSFFMLPTRIHERYLVYALPFFAINAFRNKSSFFIYLLLSTTFFLNLVHVLSSDYNYLGYGFFAGIEGEEVVISLTNVLLFLYLTTIFFHGLDKKFFSRYCPSKILNILSRKRYLILIIAFLVLTTFTGYFFIVQSPSEQGVFYLSDLPYVSARQGYGVLTKDKSVDNNSLLIASEVFSRGLGTHSYSEIVYNLSSLNVSRFLSWVGVDDEVRYGSVVFEVYGDNKLLYHSRLLKKGDGPDSVNVSVEGVSLLKLVVTDGKDRGGYGDHADWADAKLVNDAYILTSKTTKSWISLFFSRLVVLMPLILLVDLFYSLSFKLNLGPKRILVVLLLVSILVLQCLASMRYENLTTDESGHIGGGYAYIKEGEFRVGGLSSMEHPPLVRSISALPLLFMENVSFVKRGGLDWYKMSHFRIGGDLVYGNREKTEDVIFYTRLSIVFLSVLLGFYVFLWSARLYGFNAGLLSLFLYAFNPNILAHSRLVTTDIGAACFIFIAVYYLWDYLREPTKKSLFLSGVSFGFAFVAKVSGIMLVPVYLILVLAGSLSRGLTVKSILKRYLSRIVVLTFLALVIINMAYGFQDVFRPLNSFQLSSRISKFVLNTPLKGLPLPLPSAYILGVDYGMRHSERGHLSYFLGKVTGSGSWYYYPVVFLIKNPIPMLLLLIALILLYLKVQTDLFNELFLLIPVIMFFLILSQSHANIGLRHILPAFPFMFAYMGRVAAGEYNKVVIYSLCAFYLYSACSIYPHYLAYFNALIGGPDEGFKYSVVSDLDWGQDMKGLAEYVRKNNITNLKYSKYGTADTDYYNLSYEPLPCNKTTGIIAIHAANLMRNPECNRWLTNYTPYSKIGYSIFLYNINE